MGGREQLGSQLEWIKSPANFFEVVRLKAGRNREISAGSVDSVPIRIC